MAKEAKTAIDMTAKAFKERARKRIEAPSGNVYIIKRVLPFKFIGIAGGIPDLGPDVLAKMPEAERLAHASRVMARSGAEASARMEMMITAGLLSPKVGTGADEIEVDDIPAEDIGVLLMEITTLAGAGLASRAALDPTSAGAVS